MDLYLVIQLPHIWSPIYNHGGSYNSYEFKWIQHIGSMMIQEVVISCGGQILQGSDYIKNRMKK